MPESLHFWFKTHLTTKKACRAHAFFYAWLFVCILVCQLLVTNTASADNSPPSLKTLAACEAVDVHATGIEPVHVQRVVDGDTVQLNDGRKIRFIGLNTPELSPRRQTTPESGAVAAKNQLADWVLQRPLYLRVGEPSEDKYGRTLGHLYRQDGQSLEALMLAAGMGFRIAIPPNLRHQGCFQEAEAVARKAARGVWGLPQHQVLEALSRQSFSGGFARVRATVTQIDVSRHGWWVELSNDLVLRIRQSDWQYFSLAELKTLQGRTIEVRGWVIYRGAQAVKGRKPWLMELHHPLAISTLQQ